MQDPQVGPKSQEVRQWCAVFAQEDATRDAVGKLVNGFSSVCTVGSHTTH